MARLVGTGFVLLIGAALGACTANNHRFATTGGTASTAVAAPAPISPPAGRPAANGANNPAISFNAAGTDRQAVAAAANSYCAGQGKVAAFAGRNGSRLAYDCIPAGNAKALVAAAPAYGNGAANPSISYDATRYDRQALDAQAVAYCAGQGKTAALSGRAGSRVSYDCVPRSDAAPAAPPYDPNTPSVTYQLTGDNRQAMEADAASYCSAMGRLARLHGQEGARVTFDCLPDPSRPAGTAVYATAAVEPPPPPPAPPPPTISYDMASDGNPDAPAVRYCAMLGKTPLLRSQDGRRVTYECQ
jgi:putative hemolysin